eukprot:11570718-Alexandrium_andersonii.AAC.1
MLSHSRYHGQPCGMPARLWHDAPMEPLKQLTVWRGSMSPGHGVKTITGHPMASASVNPTFRCTWSKHLYMSVALAL